VTVAALVEAGRAAAEALMVDACTITRAGAAGAFNPITGGYGSSSTSVYVGKCRVQIRSASVSTPEFGGQAVVVQQVELQVPMSVLGVRPGDTVTVTASQRDPDLVGRVYTVSAPFAKTDATARRLRVEEVIEP
jgi:hypothetical protein